MNEPVRYLLAIAFVAALICPAEAAPPSFPTTPFSAGRLIFGNTPTIISLGNNKTLGATSISMSNFTTVTQQMFVAAAGTSGANCTGTINSYSEPEQYYLLPPQQTTHITFPTPLVIPKLTGGSCISFQVTTALNNDSVAIQVNGFEQ